VGRIERHPDTIGNTLGHLRHGVAGLRVHHEKGRELVDLNFFCPKVPVDGHDFWPKYKVPQARLFSDFPQGGLGRTLAVLKVPLRKSPVAVGITDYERMANAIHRTQDDTSRTLLDPNGDWNWQAWPLENGEADITPRILTDVLEEERELIKDVFGSDGQGRVRKQAPDRALSILNTSSNSINASEG